MNLLTLKYNRVIIYLERVRSDSLGLYFSFFLHFLILLSAIGLPDFFGPKQVYIPTIIPIEIINISETTSIPKENNDKNSQDTKKQKIKIKEKKFNSSNNQEIKKIDIKIKPKIKESTIEKKILPKEKEIKNNEERKEVIMKLEKQKTEINTNNFESLPTKKIKPKMKPKIIKQKVKKNLKSDLAILNKPLPKPEPEFTIASMLKDLRNEKTTKKVENETEDKVEEIIEKKQDETLNEASQLSISEIDLVLQQLSRCFIAPAGAEIKKTMFVKIAAKIQPNRKVYENSIRIVDTNISKSSSVYGPITESAMRTLLNPECIPLKLPENKYNVWKNLTMKFDYSVMRGN